MASDGSIIINTLLDNEEFEKGIGKLERAIKDLINAVDNIGDNMMQSFSQMIPVLQSLSAETSRAYSAMTQSGNDVIETNEQIERSQDSVADSAKEASKEIDNEVKTAHDAAQELSNTSRQIHDIGANISKTVDTSTFNKDIKSAESEANKLSNQFARLGDSLAMGLKTDTQMQRFTINLGHARDAAQQLTRKVYELKNQKIPTEDYQRITNELKKAESALFRLYDKQDALNNDSSISETSSEWIRLQKQIERAENKVEQYEAVQRQMKQSGNAFVSGAYTQEVSALASKLHDLQQKLVEYERTAAGFDKLSAPAAHSVSSVNALRGSMSKAVSTAGKLVKQFAKMTLSKVANGFKNLVSRIKSFVSNGKNARLTANGITKSLLNLKNMLISRVKRTLITQIFNQAKESLQTLALFSDKFNASMSNITNRSKELSANLAVSLGNLVNAVTPALTAILNLVSKAFTYLNSFFAMLSGQNTVIVAKKQTASYADSLKDTSSSASDTADSVAELNEQLYGFDEITKQTATDATAFDSNTGVTADATDGSNLFETVAVKSYLPKSIKNYFDKLKSAIKSGNWYEVGNTMADGFATACSWLTRKIKSIDATDLGKSVSRFFNGVFGNERMWYNIGELVGTSAGKLMDFITAAIEEFDVEAAVSAISVMLGQIFSQDNLLKFRDLCLAAGSKLADLINATLGNPERMGRLGTKIGKLISSLLDGIITFLENTDETGVANGLAAFCTALFSNAHLEKLLTIFSTGINKLAKMVSTFLGKYDWFDLGRAFGDDVSEAIDDVNWYNVATAIYDFVEAIIEFAAGLLSNEKLWGSVVNATAKFGQSLVAKMYVVFTGDEEGGEILNNLYMNTKLTDDLQELFDMLFVNENRFENWSILKDLYDDFYGFSEMADWFDEKIRLVCTSVDLLKLAVTGKIGESSGTIGGGISCKDTTDELGGLTETADGTSTALSGVTDEAQFAGDAIDDLSDVASNGRTNLAQYVEDVKKSGENTSTGFSDGVKSGKNTIISAVKTGITDPATSAAKSNLGIKSPSRVFKQYGIYTIQGFINGINSMKNAIATVMGSMKNNAVSGFGDICTPLYNKFIDAWNSIAGIDWFSLGDNMLNGIMSGLSNIGNSIANWGNALVQDFKEFFDIHSPSRLFRDEVGYYLGAGIAAGLENTEGLVCTAAKGLSGAMTSQLRKIEIQPAVQIPNAATLRNIATTYGAPAVLNAMPQHTKAKIARGETIAPNGSTQAQSDAILNKLDALITAIMRSDSGNTGSQQTEQRFVVEIDGREATNSVVRRINMITRATGKSPLMS